MLAAALSSDMGCCLEMLARVIEDDMHDEVDAADGVSVSTISAGKLEVSDEAALLAE